MLGTAKDYIELQWVVLEVFKVQGMHICTSQEPGTLSKLIIQKNCNFYQFFFHYHGIPILG